MTSKSKTNKDETVWIDLSDMLNWRGHFTGIQRVVYNLTKRFNGSDLNVRYFHYDAGRNIFVENYFSELDKILNNKAVQPEGVQSTANTSGKTKKIVKYAARVPLRVKSRLAKSINNNSNLQDLTELMAGFKKEDLVIVLGGNWDKPGYMPLMKELKESIGFKFYQMYYDLIPIFDSGHVAEVEHTRFKKYIDDTLSIADGGFAISKHTKKDLEKYMSTNGLAKTPINVIRLGDDIVLKEAKVKAIENVKSLDYILVVGTIEVRKNHAILYYALKELVKKGIDLPNIVIAGKIGWLTSDILYQFQHDPNLKDNIKIIQNTTDQELSWLYQNCKFTLYPSFYEGWGLPVAESLQYGKPCIASNSSSIPEIAGNLIDYHSPFNSAELAELIEKYLHDKDYLNTKIKKIQTNYRTYSWDDTFEQTLESLI